MFDPINCKLPMYTNTCSMYVYWYLQIYFEQTIQYNIKFN